MSLWILILCARPRFRLVAEEAGKKCLSFHWYCLVQETKFKRKPKKRQWIKTFSKKSNLYFPSSNGCDFKRKWQKRKQSTIIHPTRTYFLCNFISSTKHENLQHSPFFSLLLYLSHFLRNQRQTNLYPATLSFDCFRSLKQ